MSRPSSTARLNRTVWRPERCGRLRIILAACVLGVLAFSLAASAAPFRGYYKFTQPDGVELTLWGEGDEFQAVFETTTGYTVVFDVAAQAYYFAERAVDGQDLVSTGVLAHEAPPRGLALHVRMDRDAMAARAMERRRQWEADMNLASRWALRKAATLGTPLPSDLALAPPPGTTVGAKQGLTLLIDFPDVPNSVPISEVNGFLNGTAYTGGGNNGSVKEYFADNSAGRLTYTNVYPNFYIRMAQPKSYYANTSLDCGQQGRLLITDAMNILKARSDYNSVILPTLSGLSTDGSSRVLALNVLYAGTDGGVWAKGLWPHSWNLASNIALGNGKYLYWYQITNIGTSLQIGTFSHENGHMLCDFPDVYDYGYDSIGGAGVFCLMNSGGHGTNPSQVSAYLKLAAGWGTAIDITSATNGAGSLKAAPTAGYDTFYRFRKPGVATEYYLVENRQKVHRDVNLPAAGIAVWHVDELGNKDDQRMVPNTLHQNYELTLVQADNLWHFQNDVNSGDARDLYYQGNAAAGYINRIDDWSGPHAHWWDGTLSGMRLSAFSLPAATMTFTIGAGGAGLDAPVLAAEPAVTPGTTNTIYWSAVTPAPEAFATPPAQAPLPGTVISSETVETGFRDVVPAPVSVDQTTEGATQNERRPAKGTVGNLGEAEPVPVQVVLDPDLQVSMFDPNDEAKPFIEPPQLAWTTIKNETFEGIWPAAPWQVLGTPTWDDTSYAYHGGYWSGWCADSSVSPASGYPNNMNAWMIYGPFSLADASSANMTFWFKNLSEAGYDYFQWFSSVDGVNFNGFQDSGDQNSWRQMTLDLSNRIGQPQVWIAFRFVSDSSIAGLPGAYVDDIVIQKDVTPKPDLTPGQPAEWNNRIPIGIAQLDYNDVHNYAGAFYDNQTLYFNWEALNQGNAATASTFTVRAEVTGTGGGAWTWTCPSGISGGGGWCRATYDQAVGPLAAGSHTFKVWVDYGGTIAESNEANNYYERTITVGTATPTVQYYAESDDNAGFTTPVNSGWISGTSTTFSGLTPGATYYYRVKARAGTEVSPWSNVEHSQQQAADAVTITAGPSGTPNPVVSAGTASLTVTATDSLGHSLNYAWAASCAWAASNGTFNSSALRTPTWTAPANNTGATQNCTISVSVNDGLGHSASRAYLQGVLNSSSRPDLRVSTMTRARHVHAGRNDDDQLHRGEQRTGRSGRFDRRLLLVAEQRAGRRRPAVWGAGDPGDRGRRVVPDERDPHRARRRAGHVLRDCQG